MKFTQQSKKIILSLATSLALTMAQADTSTIAYQGVAFNNGVTVASTPIALRFTILQSDGTTVVYQETKGSVTTTDKGFFSHQIGSGTRTAGAATYGAITWQDGYKLKVEVDYANGTTYTDLGIQEFSSSVYALKAKTATKLETPRTIAGVSFDGTANIELPGVSAAGDQNTTGNAATATKLLNPFTLNGTELYGGETATILTYSSQSNQTVSNENFLLYRDSQYGAVSEPHFDLDFKYNEVTQTLTAGTFNGNLSGNAATATALAANPTDCSSGYFATTIAANGNLSCAIPTGVTNLTATAGTTSGPTINSSTGTNVVIPSASGTASGVVTTGAQTFAGTKTFNSTISGSIDGNAATASTVSVAAVTTGTPYYLAFVGGTAGNNGIRVNTALWYSASAQVLYGNFAGNLSGTASGNVANSGGAITGSLNITGYDTVSYGTNQNTVQNVVLSYDEEATPGLPFTSDTVHVYYGSETQSVKTSLKASYAIVSPAFLALSDKRIKDNITPLNNSLDIINKLNPVSYTKIDKVANGNRLETGFIAQEVKEIVPNAVSVGNGDLPVLKKVDEYTFEDGVKYKIQITKDGKNEQQDYIGGEKLPEGKIYVISKEVNDFHSIQYDVLYTHAIKAIQEQQKLIETLQNEIKEIKNELQSSKINNK